MTPAISGFHFPQEMTETFQKLSYVKVTSKRMIGEGQGLRLKVKVRVNDLNLSSWLESMIKDVPSPGSKLFRNFVFLNVRVRHYSANVSKTL